MIGDIMEGILEGWLHGKVKLTSRGQVIARLFIGLVGASLSITGAVKFALDSQFTRNLPMRLSIIGTFVFLAGFCVFNVMLFRAWRWPIRCFILSFILLFATRILLGL